MSAVHAEPFKGAGETFLILSTGDEITVEDYWDRVSGTSWTISDRNPAALQYGIRIGLAGLPLDDEVVYGKVGGYGRLVHVSELGEVRS